MDVFKRLISGVSLTDIGLASEGGRLMLENVSSPRIKVVKKYSVGLFDVEQTSGFPTARRVHWKKMHFRRCDLREVRLLESKIEDCTFEGCKLQSVGLWESQVNHCRFMSCDLRQAALGGVDRSRPRPNLYTDTEFVDCDLRETAHSCETYLRCQFVDCRTDQVDFMGSVFEECNFIGTLEDTTFRSLDARLSNLARNRLAGCDLKDANLRSCQFLGIDMQGMVLPTDPELLVLPQGPNDLARWTRVLAESGSDRKRWYLSQLQKEMGKPGLFSLELAGGIFSPQEIHELESLLKADA